MQVINIISMDAFDIFFPKVLCLIINSYVARCHDCNTYLINDFTCTTCKIIRCQYCNFINSNTKDCVECSNNDKYKHKIHIISCINCGNDDAYYSITDGKIEYCYDHIPQNVNMYTYDTFCHEKICIGTAIYIDVHNNKYCSKHAKLHNGVLSRYTTIKK